MTGSADRKRWSELASVGIVAAAGAIWLFEVFQSKLPGYMRTAIEQSNGLAAWAVAASIGLSLLFTGVGVMSISALRLFAALRRSEPFEVRAIAKDHLGSTVMVIAGFVLSVVALFVLSQIRA
jgi:hypothetical protein